jgi:hypothetical protein
MIRNHLIFALPVAVMLAATPAAAQDSPESPAEDEGRSLMQEGARMFWEGIRREMGPALDTLRDQAEEVEPALRDFVEEMGPALRDLMDKAGDLSAYHAPEVLPNGDIILRRKTPQETEEAPDEPASQGEIEI